MFFNRQKKYNAKVTALLPVFGINLEENGLNKLLPILNTARENKFNEHEGAITLAYYYVAITSKLNIQIAKDLFVKIQTIQNDWLNKSLLRSHVVADAEKSIKEKIFGPLGANANDDGYPFTANMPNVTNGETLRTYLAEGLVGLLVRDAPTIGESTSGQEIPLKFPYTFVLMSNDNGQPIYYVTLEKGISVGAFLCIFGRDGQHSNLGQIDESMSESEFEKKAIDIIENEFKIKLQVNSG